MPDDCTGGANGAAGTVWRDGARPAAAGSRIPPQDPAPRAGHSRHSIRATSGEEPSRTGMPEVPTPRDT
jgi:hypothetical protein